MPPLEFSQILESLPTLSPEELHQLRCALDARIATPPELANSDEGLQRQLLAAGIISEIKPPITDFSPYRDRKPVPILGEPISETVIRDRR